MHDHGKVVDGPILWRKSYWDEIKIFNYYKKYKPVWKCYDEPKAFSKAAMLYTIDSLTYMYNKKKEKDLKYSQIKKKV